MEQRHSLYPGILVCALAGGFGLLPRLCAQEALRTALESDAAARLRNQPVVRPPGDVMRWGPATFDVSLSYSLEATDNATYVETDRRKDLIQRPMLELGVLVQLSPQSRLDVRTGVGYEDYIDNSVEDTFFINPGSELALDVRMGNAIVTLFDRVDYSQDVVDAGAVAGVGRFPELENVVGLRSVWNFDKWVYHAGYSHLNVFITDDGSGAGTADFSYLERAEEQFFGRAGYNFAQPVQLGLEATGTLTDYDSEAQRDYYTISAGPYLTWTAADALEITLRGGVAYSVYSGTNGLSEDDELTSYYAGVHINHRLTDFITYHFSATHDIRAAISLGSDYIETTRLELEGDWRMTRHLTWTSTIFGEMAEEVGAAETEEYRRFGVSVGPFYRLTDHFSCFARYAFNLRDSDIESRSYVENRAALGVSYRF